MATDLIQIRCVFLHQECLSFTIDSRSLDDQFKLDLKLLNGLI